MNTIPEPLKTHWELLEEEVIWLHGRWKLYRQLYGTGPERIELLNESAGAFFYVIQNVLLNDVQLTLSKLADPASNRSQKNLTLQTLIDDISALKDSALADDIAPLYDRYRARCTAVVHRRHKQIAHLDLHSLLNSKSSPIPGPSRQEIEDALSALRDFMNRVQRDFTQSETAYKDVPLGEDGDTLLYVLAQGLRYAELVRAGKLDRLDFRG